MIFTRLHFSGHGHIRIRQTDGTYTILGWSYLKVEDPNEGFVTSDNPVSLFSSELSATRCCIAAPVSPRYWIFLFDSDSLQLKIDPRVSSSELVADLNALQGSVGVRSVFSSRQLPLLVRKQLSRSFLKREINPHRGAFRDGYTDLLARPFPASINAQLIAERPLSHQEVANLVRKRAFELSISKQNPQRSSMNDWLEARRQLGIPDDIFV